MNRCIDALGAPVKPNAVSAPTNCCSQMCLLDRKHCSLLLSCIVLDDNQRVCLPPFACSNMQSHAARTGADPGPGSPPDERPIKLRQPEEQAEQHICHASQTITASGCLLLPSTCAFLIKEIYGQRISAHGLILLSLITCPALLSPIWAASTLT